MSFVLWVLTIIIFGIFYSSLSSRVAKLEDNLKKSEQEERTEEPRKEKQREEFKKELQTEPERQPQEETEVEESTPKKKETDEDYRNNLEFQLGSRVFTIIGSVAVMLGAAFFLRFAFENNLITEPMRVVLGVLAGAFLLFVGYYFREKYSVYSQIVTGGGLGVLYLSMYASSSALYALLPNSMVLVAMGLITALGVSISLYFNSSWLAAFSQMGGFLAPLLLSVGALSSHLIFVYLLILNLGILFIAMKKSWIYLSITGLLGTMFVYFTWFSVHYSSQTQVLKEIFLYSQSYGTIFVSLFIGMAIFQFFNNREEEEAIVSLVSLSTLFYFTLTYLTVNELYPDWMGVATFGLGLIYFVLAYRIHKRAYEPGWFRDLLVGIGCLFFVIGVPIHFNKHWITISWAAEGLLMAVVGLKAKSNLVRSFAHGVFWFMTTRLLFFESALPTEANAFANNRFLTYSVAFVFMAIAVYLFNKYKESLTEGEVNATKALSILSFLVFVSGGTLEINQFFSEWWLPLFFASSSLIALWSSLKIRQWTLRAFSYVPLTMGTVYLLIYTDTLLEMDKFTFLMNVRVATTIVFSLIMGVFLWILNKNKERLTKEEESIPSVVFVGINILLLRLVGVEVLDLFNHQLKGVVDWSESTLQNLKNVTLSAAWALYAVVLLIIGIIKKSALARIFAILVFGFVILKVFLYDTASLNDFYRFVSFGGLGAILLITGYLYYHFEDRIMKFIKAEED